MLLDVCTLAFFFCLGISWLLQVAIYPTYRLVGKPSSFRSTSRRANE